MAINSTQAVTQTAVATQVASPSKVKLPNCITNFFKKSPSTAPATAPVVTAAPSATAAPTAALTKRQARFLLSGVDTGSELEKLYTETAKKCCGKAIYFFKHFIGHSKARKDAIAADKKFDATAKADPAIVKKVTEAVAAVVEQAKKANIQVKDQTGFAPTLVTPATPEAADAVQMANETLQGRITDLTKEVMKAASPKGHASIPAYVNALMDMAKEQAEGQMSKNKIAALVGDNNSTSGLIPTSMLNTIVTEFVAKPVENMTPEELQQFVDSTVKAFDGIIAKEVVEHDILTALSSKNAQVIAFANKCGDEATIKQAQEDALKAIDGKIEKQLARLTELRGTNGYNGLISKAWQTYFSALKDSIEVLGYCVNVTKSDNIYNEALKAEVQNLHFDSENGEARLLEINAYLSSQNGNIVATLLALKPVDQEKLLAATKKMTEARSEKDKLNAERMEIGGDQFNPEQEGSYTLVDGKKIWNVGPNTHIANLQEEKKTAADKIAEKLQKMAVFFANLSQLLEKFVGKNRHPVDQEKINFMATLGTDASYQAFAKRTV